MMDVMALADETDAFTAFGARFEDEDDGAEWEGEAEEWEEEEDEDEDEWDEDEWDEDEEEEWEDEDVWGDTDEDE